MTVALEDTDPRLIAILTEAGREWGPLGVAQAAAQLAKVPYDQIIPTLENPFLSVEQVSELFSVTNWTVREWIKDGKMRAIKIPGNKWRIQKSSVIEFANKQHGDEE